MWEHMLSRYFGPLGSGLGFRAQGVRNSISTLAALLHILIKPEVSLKLLRPRP